ncbi:MAG: methyltransferase domain-containing protein [Candidatus Sulfotelmatobacter sp.]
MGKRVCPWWLGYFLASPLRRFLQDPGAMVAPYVHSGMTVLEPGPGMGFFTLEVARRVGPHGRVVALDVQPRMIGGLKRRLAKAGLLDRVEPRLVSADSLGVADLKGKVDFTLAMAVVHEMPTVSSFFRQAREAMKSGSLLLLIEPSGHVTEKEFQDELAAAADAGFAVIDRPNMRRSHSAVLKNTAA